MKRTSILFVSPGGTATKTIRVKLIWVIIVSVFVVAGFSAYFIPSEKFRLKAAEVRQKHALSAQNEMLHQRVGSALGTLDRLKQQIASLGKKKERVVELTGTKMTPNGRSGEGPGGAGAGYARDTRRDPEELLHDAQRLESKLRALTARLCSGAAVNPFDSVPVCKPVGSGAIVSLAFGPSRDPFTGRESFHRGVDFSAPAGAAVIATAAGTVVRVEKDAVWGNRVIVACRDSVSVVYAHLGTVKTVHGRRVKRGTTIGTVGLSGLATGPHVHYEIWRRGKPVDPAVFFYPAISESSQSPRR